MANKRSLKRAIRSICEELFAEAIAVSMYGPEPANHNAEAQLYSIVRMEEDFISRVCHPEPGMSPRAYYKNLREQFSAQVSDIIDQLNG